MTSIYPSVFIETGIVTHFSGYKMMTIHSTKTECYMFQTTIFYFSSIEILLNFVEAFILHWLL